MKAISNELLKDIVECLRCLKVETKYANRDIQASMCIDEINKVQQSPDIQTIHHNACVNTINACIEHWGIDMTDRTCPTHPMIDTVKKQ